MSIQRRVLRTLEPSTGDQDEHRDQAAETSRACLRQKAGSMERHPDHAGYTD